MNAGGRPDIQCIPYIRTIPPSVRLCISAFVSSFHVSFRESVHSFFAFFLSILVLGHSVLFVHHKAKESCVENKICNKNALKTAAQAALLKHIHDAGTEIKL